MKRASQMGYLAGALLSITLLTLFFLPSQSHFRQPGPMNSGHEDMDCLYCHETAAGTTRQQIQANVRYWLGLRQTAVDFGHRPVTSENCQQCHERPADNHPIFRFLEPRFAEARQAIQPESCLSCHQEHQGQRVTSDPANCVHCHQDTVLEEDPITIPHAELINRQEWASCLGCHDFHGNHVMTLRTDTAELIPPAQIQHYFGGGPSPYSDVTRYQAKESPDE
jgi:hypothetical protein